MKKSPGIILKLKTSSGLVEPFNRNVAKRQSKHETNHQLSLNFAIAMGVVCLRAKDAELICEMLGQNAQHGCTVVALKAPPSVKPDNLKSPVQMPGFEMLG